MHQAQNWLTVDHDGWHLPATIEPKDDCGKWLTKGCLNVPAHAGSEYEGKIFIKTFQKSCYRAACQTCFRKWMARESNKATRRIEKYEKLSKKPAKEMRKQAYKILKSVNAVGGSLIFHPFRYHKDIQQWYYSPHFHCIGFGWISNVEEIYKKNGWIVKNKGTRDSVFATFYYQLSHAGIKHGYHSVTWFGDLSYSKLKVEEEQNPDVCPLCSAKLRPIYYYGLFANVPPPEMAVEMYLDPEGWHILEPKPFFKESKNCDYNYYSISSVNDILKTLAEN